MAKKEEAKEKVATKEVAEKPASKSTKSTKSTKKAQPVIEVEPVEEKPKAKKLKRGDSLNLSNRNEKKSTEVDNPRARVPYGMPCIL